jgi:hypothetical protein
MDLHVRVPINITKGKCKRHYQNAVSAYCSDRNVDTGMLWRYIGCLLRRKEGREIRCPSQMKKADTYRKIGLDSGGT